MKRLTILLTLLLVPAIVLAHVYLRGSEPEDGAVLEEQPAKVTISFVGSLETAFSKLEVFDPEGNKVSKKTRFLESDSVMEVELTGELPAGHYEARWLCVSMDGHKQKGKFSFTIQ